MPTTTLTWANFPPHSVRAPASGTRSATVNTSRRPRAESSARVCWSSKPKPTRFVDDCAGSCPEWTPYWKLELEETSDMPRQPAESAAGSRTAERYGAGAVGFHHISPRETLAFRPARDSDVRSTARIPRPAFLHVFEGVVGGFLGILYGCPALDLPLFGFCACG